MKIGKVNTIFISYTKVDKRSNGRIVWSNKNNKVNRIYFRKWGEIIGVDKSYHFTNENNIVAIEYHL